MRVNLFLDDVITGVNFRHVQEIVLANSDIFSELAIVAGLDPKNDFRYSNLSGVDFKSSDLRGYDFTGADLRGAVGIDVTWDETTKLDKAEVSGSLFAYEVAKRQLFSNSVWKREFERRNRDYWSKNIEWFSDRLVKGHRDRSTALELAKAVCDSTSDIFLRSQLLFFIAPAFDRASDHRDYLIHNIAKHSDDVITTRVTLQTLSTLYNNDRSIFGLLKQHLNHNDHLVRDAAMKGILNSRHLGSHITEITKIIKRFSLAIRQAFLKRVGQMIGVSTQSLRDSFGRIYDINELITRSAVERAAFFQLRLEDTKRAENMRISGDHMPISDPNRDRVSERSRTIRSDLDRFIVHGIPLRLEWHD